MSDVGTAVPRPAAAQPSARDGGVQNRIAELRVSGHLMTLDTGLFCVFQGPGSAAVHERSGLPGVRISLPPGPAGRPEAIAISTFRDDGWLNGRDSAALVRVTDGPAQVLVTVYQSPNAPPEAAPRLQVMRIGADPGAEATARGVAAAQAAPPAIVPADAEIVVHVQRSGDVAGRIGGSGRAAAGSGSRVSASSRARPSKRRMSNTRRCWAAAGCRHGSRGASSAAAAAWRCRCSASSCG